MCFSIITLSNILGILRQRCPLFDPLLPRTQQKQAPGALVLHRQESEVCDPPGGEGTEEHASRVL